MEEIKKYAQMGGTVIYPPEEFKTKYEKAILDAVEFGLNHTSSQQAQDLIDKRKKDENRTIAFGEPNLVSGYERMHEEHAHLINVRKQEIYSDLVERFRLLLFRVLTAIGIATVVLCTGYFANKFGIPLPLLRIPT